MVPLLNSPLFPPEYVISSLPGQTPTEVCITDMKVLGDKVSENAPSCPCYTVRRSMNIYYILHMKAFSAKHYCNRILFRSCLSLMQTIIRLAAKWPIFMVCLFFFSQHTIQVVLYMMLDNYYWQVVMTFLIRPLPTCLYLVLSSFLPGQSFPAP